MNNKAQVRYLSKIDKLLGLSASKNDDLYTNWLQNRRMSNSATDKILASISGVKKSTASTKKKP